MPRRSLQLNDFSGGLNTKSSPRDIAPNQVTKADNVNLHNPGLILSSSTSSAKLSTANAPNAQTTAGYGAFMFNSQYNTDVSGTEEEKYQANIGEVVYTVAPGLKAKVTYTDYEYKNGSESRAAGDDSGQITNLTISASF